MSEVLSNPTAEKYEWQKSIDGSIFVRIDLEKPNYFGSNLIPKSPVLVIPKPTFDDKGYYRLSIWNKFGENVSNTIELKITGSMLFFLQNLNFMLIQSPCYCILINIMYQVFPISQPVR